jgi:hypothetical protein
LTWRPRYTSGNVTAALLGDPAPNRIERADALRRSLPEPRDDERDDLEAEPDALSRAIRSGATAVAEFYGLTQGVQGWEKKTTAYQKQTSSPDFSQCD